MRNSKSHLPQEVTCSQYHYLEDISDSLAFSPDDCHEFLSLLGEELIYNNGDRPMMDKAFRSLGASFQEFLTTLDGVLDVLQGQKEDTQAASFICTPGTLPGVLDLLLTTERPPVAHLMVGSLRAIAAKLYSTQIDVCLIPDDLDPKVYRYDISIVADLEDDDADVVTQSKSEATLSDKAADLRIGVASFCKAFPWHFIIDRRLQLVQLGSGFMRIFGRLVSEKGLSVETYFEFKRPWGVEVSFRGILQRANSPFLLMIRNVDDRSPSLVQNIKFDKFPCSQQTRCGTESSAIESPSSVILGVKEPPFKIRSSNIKFDKFPCSQQTRCGTESSAIESPSSVILGIKEPPFKIRSSVRFNLPTNFVFSPSKFDKFLQSQQTRCGTESSATEAPSSVILGVKEPPFKLHSSGLELKGQMVYCPESDSILFVGSPFLNGLESLTGRGLFISDIPLHDATRDVVLVGEQARAQDGLKRRMDKLKNTIEEASLAVDKEREKNVSLLHLIFPPDIAKRLWLGETIEAKHHENVTMLFSDIVGFTSICSTATPFMVISMLENLYNQFDVFCGQLDVYKVETIGDAYCVAAGLHKQCNTHAQQTSWMAIMMMNTCPKHLTHQGGPIKCSSKNMVMHVLSNAMAFDNFDAPCKFY
ncbi:Guanylate cyclase soluble subunit alpha-2 [Homalodisca vitripennis]|nr:Guanylate cyclase soluble subunit alpha-2 [Homalodisca vitripennis]